MGRGKVELKRIEDKTSRQVSFSKRRNGLMKKAYELAVLCDVDLALIVFSPRDKLFEFSTGESMSEILTRYQSFKETQELTRVIAQERLAQQDTDVFTADELTQKIQRPLEENNIKLLDITGLDQLEQQLNSFLRQVKIKEMELKMGVVKALKDQEMQLKKERKYMMDEIMAAGMDGINNYTDDAEPQPPVMAVQITW